MESKNCVVSGLPKTAEVYRVFTAAVQSGGNLELLHGWGDPVTD